MRPATNLSCCILRVENLSRKEATSIKTDVLRNNAGGGRSFLLSPFGIHQVADERSGHAYIGYGGVSPTDDMAAYVEFFRSRGKVAAWHRIGLSDRDYEACMDELRGEQESDIGLDDLGVDGEEEYEYEDDDDERGDQEVDIEEFDEIEEEAEAEAEENNRQGAEEDEGAGGSQEDVDDGGGGDAGGGGGGDLVKQEVEIEQEDMSISSRRLILRRKPLAAKETTTLGEEALKKLTEQRIKIIFAKPLRKLAHDKGYVIDTVFFADMLGRLTATRRSASARYDWHHPLFSGDDDTTEKKLQRLMQTFCNHHEVPITLPPQQPLLNFSAAPAAAAATEGGMEVEGGGCAPSSSKLPPSKRLKRSFDDAAVRHVIRNRLVISFEDQCRVYYVQASCPFWEKAQDAASVRSVVETWGVDVGTVDETMDALLKEDDAFGWERNDDAFDYREDFGAELVRTAHPVECYYLNGILNPFDRTFRAYDKTVCIDRSAASVVHASIVDTDQLRRIGYNILM